MQLHFRIGCFTYKTAFADQPLTYNDSPAMALIHGDRRMIEFSPDCPPGERLDTLCHEWWHANAHHYPPPPTHDEEAMADYYATVTASLFRQIEAQGGAAALMALEMDTMTGFDPAAFGKSLAEFDRDRCLSCAVCQQRIAAGNVLVTRPTAHPSNGAPIVGLAFHCPHCDHVQSWTEFLNAGGRPTGVCALEPTYIGGAEAAAFCEAHPDKTMNHPAS